MGIVLEIFIFLCLLCTWANLLSDEPKQDELNPFSFKEFIRNKNQQPCTTEATEVRKKITKALSPGLDFRFEDKMYVCVLTVQVTVTAQDADTSVKYG